MKNAAFLDEEGINLLHRTVKKNFVANFSALNRLLGVNNATTFPTYRSRESHTLAIFPFFFFHSSSKIFRPRSSNLPILNTFPCCPLRTYEVKNKHSLIERIGSLRVSRVKFTQEKEYVIRKCWRDNGKLD